MRFGNNFGSTKILVSPTINVHPGAQFRSLWSISNNPISNFTRSLQLKRLELIANSSLDDAAAHYAFLTELAQSHPHAVITRLRHPAFHNAAVDGNVGVLYLQTLQQTNQMNLFDYNDFCNRLQQTTAAPVQHWKQYITEKKLSKSDQVQHLLQWLIHGGGPGNANVAGGALASQQQQLLHQAPLATGINGQRGLSPKQPLHVQVITPPGSLRQAIVSFILRAAFILIGVSALSALLEEKGLGRGGIGGMNSGSKHVQEADATRGKKVKFADVKGVEEAKAELEEIVLYLKDPSRFTRLGGKLPRGLLLTGPPGTGKTLLAKAIAGEADVPFFYASGSQFEEVYVGLGAKRIRELFEAAKKKAPAIVFIDEIDAVGGTRKLKDQSALKMTLNELLVQMDGFDENNGIIVIGATNFVESLDAALLRPGRFDKLVTVPLPDVGGRKEILEMYAKKTKLANDVDLGVLARGTTGFSGADLNNLINQAALKASVDGLPHITMAVLEYAKDKTLMGAERKTAVITKETARCTAYHEAGHAVVAVLTDGAMPIHKATIMPRGNSLGMVTMLPEGDQTSQSLKEMLAAMDVAMGGRVAEELIFGKDAVTSGASSDIRYATNIARSMVTKWGFSDQIGIVYHGGEIGEDASSSTRNRIDEEVRKLTHAAYQRATDLLLKYSEEHKLLAETLLEYETLTGDEVRDLVKKRIKPSRPVINKNGGSRGDTTIYDNPDSKTRKGGRLFGKSNSTEVSASPEPKKS
jgi:ATP-dependent metalloprotease